MATRKTTASAYEAETLYDVTLSDRVAWGRQKLVPGQSYTIKGDVLSGPEFDGKIETAEPAKLPE